MSLRILIDPFYEKHPGKPGAEFRVGQLCRLVVPFPTHSPRILDVDRAASDEHLAVSFKLRVMNGNDFRARNKLPIKLLGLKSTEEGVLQKAKFRSGIIVAVEKTRMPEVEKALGARNHLHDATLWVVPVFGAQTETHAGGVPPILMARVEALAYRQMFPVFENAHADMIRGVARLDRVMIAIPQGPAFKALDHCLTAPAKAVLLSMLRECFGSGTETELADMRDILKDSFKQA